MSIPCWNRLAVCLTGCLAIVSGIASAGAVDDERRERLEKMSPLEKDDLRRSHQRLEQLSPEEQQRLRDLEKQLASDPDGGRLRSVMVRYHEWLRALPSQVRGELLALAPDERIPKIKAMLAQQESDRLRELAKESLTQADVDHVRVWIGDLIMRRKEDLLRQLPESACQRLAGSNDVQRFMFEWFNHFREQNKVPPPITDALQIQESDQLRLVEKLSEQALAVYRQAGTDEQYKRTVILNWVFASTFRRRPPSTEELQVFLQKLPPEERDRIENLPPEQMRAELTKVLYDTMRRFNPDNRRPGSGPGDRFKVRPGDPRSGSPNGRSGINRPSESQDPPSEPAPPKTSKS